MKNTYKFNLEQKIKNYLIQTNPDFLTKKRNPDFEWSSPVLNN